MDQNTGGVGCQKKKAQVAKPSSSRKKAIRLGGLKGRVPEKEEGERLVCANKGSRRSSPSPSRTGQDGSQRAKCKFVDKLHDGGLIS